MSKILDYSRFDNIDTSDDEDDDKNSNNNDNNNSNIVFPNEPTKDGLIPTIYSDQAPQKMTRKGKEGRLQFLHEDRLVYEWDQNIDEVNIYIEAPPGAPRSALDIVISHNHLKVGIKGNPPFLDEDTGGLIKTGESTWTLSDGEININLQKMNRAEAWNCALVGKAGEKVDAYTQEQIKKKLMLERFQDDHPGFDFSGAEFNGAIPDPREFMGGVKYN